MLLEVNSGKVEPIDSRRPETMVFDFYTETFLKWAKDNLKLSFVWGYSKLWDGTLKVHFAGRTLQGYRTHHASEFLSSLAPRMTRSSLSHVRGLGSSIFSRAVNRGVIERNPWIGVKLLSKPKPAKSISHYTMDEAKECLKILDPHPKARTAFGLGFFLALRPGELAALEWEDFSRGLRHDSPAGLARPRGREEDGDEPRGPAYRPREGAGGAVRDRTVRRPSRDSAARVALPGEDPRRQPVAQLRLAASLRSEGHKRHLALDRLPRDSAGKVWKSELDSIAASHTKRLGDLRASETRTAQKSPSRVTGITSKSSSMHVPCRPRSAVPPKRSENTPSIPQL